MSISILMPFRNCIRDLSEASWRKCLESIIGQTYHKWNCILVDDYSKDGSCDVLKSYKESRFTIIHNREHYGLTKSLNIALKSAKGLYTARHDSDDFSDSYRFRKQISFLETNPSISVVGSHAKIFDSNMNEYDRQDKSMTHDKIMYVMRKDNPMIHGSVLMRTDALRAVGGYDEEFYVCQDYDLWARMARNGCQFHNIPEYLYNRISHPNCASKTYRSLRKGSVYSIRARIKKELKNG